jgi:hypothetical protein
MVVPVIRGLIDRRILINYRADPAVLSALLPRPFRPQTLDGTGIAGICLIRLTQIRPQWLPGWLGQTSENAAQRIAVEWDDVDGNRRTGVYILRRDTSSRINGFAGGRLFPGQHHLARFNVTEGQGRYRVVMAAKDGLTHLSVEGRETEEFPKSSVFRSLKAASDFFRAGSVGYSPTRHDGRFEGLELRAFDWDVRPLGIESVESSFFDDSKTFPSGSIELDCGLLMRGVEHEWHVVPEPMQAAINDPAPSPALVAAGHSLAAPVRPPARGPLKVSAPRLIRGRVPLAAEYPVC